jgi:glycosyltransferase involved in cell wall biosynthesis
MKITYIHQHFSLPTEAGGQRPWEFARRLVSVGHQVTVLCGGLADDELNVEGVCIRMIAAPYNNSMTSGQRIRSFIKFMSKASLLSAQIDADIVFASSTPLTTAIPGIIGSRLQQTPFVFEVRDLWPSVPVELGIIRNKAVILAARALEKLTYSAADHVIALSPGMAEGVSKVSPKTNVTVIPNASDIASFAPARANRDAIRAELGWTENEVVLVYAGSFGLTYDTPWLMNLGHALREKSKRYKVVICGKGADSERLLKMAEDFEIDATEVLPGSLPKTEVMRLLAAADFAVSTMVDEPPLYVNSLNKVFDALAAATPVIFNHQGWLPALLEQHDAGIILSRDPKSAAEEVHKLVESGYDRRLASKAAFSLGKEQFDRDDLFDQFRSVLEGAAGTTTRIDTEDRAFQPLSATHDLP